MFSSNTTQVSDGGYQISRSLRFNSADSAYLNRTPASTTNRQIWTWSGWVKRGKLGVYGRVFQAREGSTGNQFFLRFNNTDTIFVTGDSGSYTLETTQVFRDPSAWYHIVFACDTTQATSSNRFKLYVNGSQVTAFGTATYPSQNLNTTVNSAFPHGIGAETSGPSEFYDGYITETYLIDGTQLTPSSFGYTNPATGVWSPLAFVGTYGTNGFYVNFSDNSNTTAATLGKDYSGNGNNWTPNNFSVTAGAGNDSLVDSPTSYGVDTGVGGTVRGNYATWNALGTNKPNLTNGNLDADGQDLKTAISTMGVSTGKWYWEILIRSGTDTPNMGVTSFANDNSDPGVYLGVGRSYVSSGGGGGIYKAYTATSTVADSDFSNANTAGATIGFALDCDAGTLSYYVNNVLGYTDSTVATGTLLFPMTTNFNSGVNAYRNTSVNFGQRPFAYTAPSGFKALCTQNLPTPTIGATAATQASKFFNPVLYTGNATTNAITGVGFQPDFVWMKNRASAYYHGLYDAVRGTGTSKSLYSNTTEAEGTNSANQNLVSFNADGFTLGATSSTNVINTSAQSHVAWNWKANGSGSTNTAGSITSTVSASTTSGFSVVTYTGTGSAATVGHGLGVAPKFIITKKRSSTSNWATNDPSQSNPWSGALLLNTTDAFVSSSTVWNNTAPTTTVFSIGTADAINVSSATYVAYCFAEVAGYSKFGSYTGNGNTNRNFVYLGFTPAVILVKRSSSSGTNWRIVTPRRVYLSPNTADAEYASYPGPFLQTANGFEISGGDDVNENGGTFIYAAFASVPFKFSLAQ